MALGAWVLTLRPRRATSLLLVAYTLLFGSYFVAVNGLVLLGVDRAVAPDMARLPILAAFWAALALALTVTRPLWRARAGWLIGPAAASAGLSLLHVVLSGDSGNVIFYFLFLAPAFLLVAAGGRLEAREPIRSQIHFIGAALPLLWGIDAGFALVLLARGSEVHWSSLLGYVALVAWWLWNMLRAPPHEAYAPRNVALALLAVMLLGAVAAAWGSSADAGFHWSRGVVRTAGVLLLVYGIVRHQLLGIDLKLKWTLKQSTVAAVFVGLFFVVSESAANFFGDRWGTYAGIGAAGLLVFAIAPLQRAAERVADRAMPGVAETDAYRESRRLELYKDAARLAWRDGTVTRDEERHLAELAQELGIGAADALRLKEEVGGEVLAEVEREAHQGGAA